MPRKVFEVSVKPPGEPIEFAIRFTFATEPDRPAEEEVFHAVSLDNVPASIDLLPAAAIFRVGEDGVGRTDLGGVVRYFTEVLVEDDVPRFRALIADKTRVVNIHLLGEILGWLLAEYGGRPTTPSLPS